MTRQTWRMWLFLALLLATALLLSGSLAQANVTRRSDVAFIQASPAGHAAAQQLRVQPLLDLDYGPFHWMAVSAADLSRLQAAQADIQWQPDPFVLDLGGLRFDPVHQTPRLPAGWDRISSGPDLHLVQFVGPTRSQWLDLLTAQGLQVVQYIHPYTYVVWGELADVNAVEATDFVRWTGPFAPAYRVLPAWRNLAGSVTVNVLLYRGADADATVRRLEQATGSRGFERAVLNATWEIIGFRVSGEAINTLASVAGVYSVQPIKTDGGLRGEMSNQINANNHDGSNLAFPGYATWLSGIGLDGNGVIIANVDSGIYHNHPDLAARIVGCTGTTCGGSAFSTHGTHTAGTMAADGSSGTTDSFGFLRGQGVAPGANLVEQVYSPFYTQPGGMLLLMTDSYNNGASLSGNSWGPSGSPQGYDDDTLQVDIGVRDADPDAPGNQPLTFVLSFMNGNGGTSTQGTPDEAKNIFTIGSTKMQNSDGSQILDINDLSSNTAHGPALDGRTIPHMVAPGCNVDSTLTATGYGLLCGTSMASPHVSGAVALFVEYYRNLFAVDPSPALIKAAFLPVAHDLAGNQDADGGTLGHPFDSKQGWGRMDLEAVLDPQVSVLYYDDPQLFDNTGEEWTGSFSPADPAQPMRFMLVWTDAPGHGLGGATPAWNNNLDLVVEADGNTYRGNAFAASGWSAPGGAADIRNNTEGVFLGPTAPSGAVVRVVATNINSDGVPNTGDGTDQDFALVCYNCASEPDYALAATPASQTVCVPSDAIYAVEVTSIAGYTEPVTLTNDAGGSFSVNPVIPTGTSNMTVTLATPGLHTITITGSSLSGDKSVAVDLNVFDGLPAAATLLSPADDAVDVSLTPTYSWTAVPTAASYDLTIFDTGGTPVMAVTGLTDTSYTFETALEPLTSYTWRVRSVNPCGINLSPPFSFTTLDTPPVLLVDDDDNNPNMQNFYIILLDGLGLEYDIWDTNNSDTEPDAATLSGYEAVLWFTGDEFGGAAGPGSAGETALATWLDNNVGCFIISSQDYLYDRGMTSFMSTYLGLGSYTSDVSQTQVTGQVGPFKDQTYTLTYPFINYSDRLNAGPGGKVVFIGNQGNASVAKAGGDLTIFLGFPVEAMSPVDADLVIGSILGRCLSDAMTPFDDFLP